MLENQTRKMDIGLFLTNIYRCLLVDEHDFFVHAKEIRELRRVEREKFHLIITKNRMKDRNFPCWITEKYDEYATNIGNT